MRTTLERKLAQKEKEEKEEKMRKMAQQAREERAGIRHAAKKDDQEARDRDQLRRDRLEEHRRSDFISLYFCKQF